jgi:hypothetical protein
MLRLGSSLCGFGGVRSIRLSAASRALSASAFGSLSGALFGVVFFFAMRWMLTRFANRGTAPVARRHSRSDLAKQHDQDGCCPETGVEIDFDSQTGSH